MLPFAVLLAPPSVMLAYRRLAWPAVLLYAGALGLLVAWGIAVVAHMDRADGQGSIVAGGGWLGAAAVAATASVVLTVRSPRRRVLTR